MDTDVLVVGGSLSGLSLSLFCAGLGVDHLVVERHPGTAVHPRINGINGRSMELFDSIGVGDRIRTAGRVGDALGEFFATDSLASEHYQPFGGPEDEEILPAFLSPTGMCACDQDLLEPILYDRARELGADPRFGVELVDFEQSPDGVTATVRTAATGVEETITASYLIAADGLRSRVREVVGASLRGPGLIEHGLSIVFRADLEPALRGRRVYAAFGSFGTLVRRNAGRWQLVVAYDPAVQAISDFTEPRCLELIHAATGLPGLDAEILTVMPLEIHAGVADGFRHGRVFLVGDAAHPSPPSGGLGGNLCVQDAHNLAWKLAAVLEGRAGTELLDTYDLERRPIADITIGCQLADVAPDHPNAHDRDYASVVFGHRYTSPAVIPDGHAPVPEAASEAASGPAAEAAAEPAAEAVEDPRHPGGRPGTRAPHLVLDRNGDRLSSVDLIGPSDRGPRFVLLAGPDGGPWRDAASDASAAVGAEIVSYVLDKDVVDVERRWPHAYAGLPTDAVLIRPDGFIGWHSRGRTSSPALLVNALERILCRTSP